MKKGDKITIHAYKHNGDIYKRWNNTYFIEETDEYILVGNKKSKVTEKDGRRWYTREPALIYFYKNRWFNIIVQLKKKGTFYYCNIATPYVIDNNTIKYIDYDLDLRIFPNGSYKVLDEGEYEYHKKEMEYSKDIDKVIHYELENLIEMFKTRTIPFQKKQVEIDYKKFLKLK